MQSPRRSSVGRITATRLLVAQAMLLAPPAVAAPGAAATPPPNILHIHADDHRPDGLHALGNPVLQTPNLDRLVASGMTFSHCYTMGSMVGAVCQPSRTMLLTGRSWLRIPGGKAANLPWDVSMSLPCVMAAAGYQTFHVGKSGNSFKEGIKAFAQCLVMDDHGPELRQGSSERHADAVIRFLDERKRSQPFYIYLAPPVPHDPRVAAPEFRHRYAAKDLPLPAAFMPLHPFDNGEMTVRDEKLAPWPRTPQDTRQQLADYYACITGLDHHVGRIIDKLRQQGLLDQTLIVFSGDNGLSLGEHGLFGKQNLYEFGGMHVPLVIAGPGIPKGTSGAFVYLMDLFPTLCEFGRARLPAGVEGRSLAPILAGKETAIRDGLYTAYRDCQRAIRDERWKLIRYPRINKTQLFDLQQDPHELNNLADAPESAGKVAEMMSRLAAKQREFGDDCPLVSANPLPAAWSPPDQTPKRKKKP